MRAFIQERQEEKEPSPFSLVSRSRFLFFLETVKLLQTEKNSSSIFNKKEWSRTQRRQSGGGNPLSRTSVRCTSGCVGRKLAERRARTRRKEGPRSFFFPLSCFPLPCRLPQHLSFSLSFAVWGGLFSSRVSYFEKCRVLVAHSTLKREPKRDRGGGEMNV